MGDVTMVVSEVDKNGILDVLVDTNIEDGDAAGAGYFYMPNDGKTVLVVVAGASVKNITFSAVNDPYGRTETLIVSPTASKTNIIGPFMPELWNQGGANAGCIKFQAATGGDNGDKYLAVRVANPR